MLHQVNKLEQNTEPTEKSHQCQQCRHYATIVEKYKSLVELLKRKVHQMNKKSYTQIIQTQSIDTSLVQTQQLTNYFEKQQMKISEQVNAMFVPSLQETATQFPPDELKEEKITLASESQGFWKCGSIINTLTSEIMQLKSNFMHVRQCLYSLFQQTNIWSLIQKTQTGQNMAMVLFSIFQYSQQQREEMCRLCKVMVRKARRQGKQNIFVTMKRI